MKYILSLLLTLVFLSGCAATWNGVKEDTTNSVDWTKSKVNQGANYIKEKTE
ncbi:MAG: hypothetical protein JZU62_04580 [Sulfuricurvum sp.]|uniref:hypothetical protein n=1 Tax=Sulfuricurvum sp. TaxID=2025608 RepID=UPI0025FDB0B6|nr:hypothetical protein [Sulfuricurvum sp.]MBV5320940.1 hypothetical protein [Sulfuricurvum sp.]